MPARVRERLRGVWRPGQLMAAATALGVAIATFQLGPFLIWGSGFDLSYRQNFRHTSLPAAALLTTFVPWALGTTQPAHMFPLSNFVDNFSFLGAAAVVFAILAVIRGAPSGVSRGVYRYCVAGAGLLALVTYTSYTLPASPLGRIKLGDPFKAFLYVLPGMSQVPISRLRAPFLFLCALIAAFGVEHVVTSTAKRKSPRTRRWWIRLGVLAMLAAYVAALVVADEHHRTAPIGQVSWVLRQSVIPALLGLGVLVIAFGMKRWGPRLRSSAIVAIPVLLAVESLLVTTPWFPRVASADYYPQSGSLQFLEQQLGHERFAAEGLMGFQSTTTFYGLRSVTGHSFTTPTWRDLAVATSPGTVSLPTLSMLGDSEQVATSPILDVLAAKYFVSAPETEPFGTKVDAPPADGSVSFGAGAAAHGTIPSEPMRAVDVTLVGATHIRGALDYVDVTVRDSLGRTVARGSRRLLQQTETQTYAVALAGESLSASRTPARVDVTIRSSTDDTARIATTRTGAADLGYIRANADGLKLVYADAGAVIYERLDALPASVGRVPPSSSAVGPRGHGARGRRGSAGHDPARSCESVREREERDGRCHRRLQRQDPRRCRCRRIGLPRGRRRDTERLDRARRREAGTDREGRPRGRRGASRRGAARGRALRGTTGLAHLGGDQRARDPRAGCARRRSAHRAAPPPTPDRERRAATTTDDGRSLR